MPGPARRKSGICKCTELCLNRAKVGAPKCELFAPRARDEAQRAVVEARHDERAAWAADA